MIGIELKYASVIPGVQCVTPGLGASNTQGFPVTLAYASAAYDAVRSSRVRTYSMFECCRHSLYQPMVVSPEARTRVRHRAAQAS